MKQLAGRGGGFFVAGKRLRGFPGLDDGRFGYYDGMGGGPDFGYPGSRFPPDFFPGGGPLAFNPAGNIKRFFAEIISIMKI